MGNLCSYNEIQEAKEGIKITKVHIPPSLREVAPISLLVGKTKSLLNGT